MDRICSGVNVRITFILFLWRAGAGAGRGGHFRADGRCLESTWRAESISYSPVTSGR